MELISLNIPLFLVIFTRITGFFMFVPFFNNKAFSARIKAGFILMITILVFPVIHSYYTINFVGFVDAGIILAMEFLIGLLMGLSMMIVLVSVQLAGFIMGFQMVFTMANTLDPASGTQANVLSVMLTSVFMLIILTLGGDRYLMKLLIRSFTEIKPGEMLITKSLIKYFVNSMQHAFVIGFKMIAPTMILMFMIDLTLGIIGKTAQKMQIFFVGIPLKVSLGLFLLTLMIGFLVKQYGHELNRSLQSIFFIFRTI